MLRIFAVDVRGYSLVRPLWMRRIKPDRYSISPRIISPQQIERVYALCFCLPPFTQIDRCQELIGPRIGRINRQHCFERRSRRFQLTESEKRLP